MSKISRRDFLKTSSMITASALVGGLSTPAFAKRPKYRLKYANNLPASHPMNVRAYEMSEKIKKDTDGEVDLRIYPSSQLGNDTDTIAQIRAGAVDFFMLSPLIMGTLIQKVQISNLGFAFKNYDQVWAAMDGDFGAAIRDVIAASSPMFAFDKIWDNGYRIVTTSTKPVNTVADLKGMKLRVPPSPILTSMFEGLGASPTTINFAETYSALQTKIVDGQENPINLLESAKLYEVQKYVSKTNHLWDGFWLTANKKNWEALPADIQKVMKQHMNDAGLAERADLAKLNKTSEAAMKEKGMLFNDVDPTEFRKTLAQAGFYDKWKKTFGDELWTKLEKAVGGLS